MLKIVEFIHQRVLDIAFTFCFQCLELSDRLFVAITLVIRVSVLQAIVIHPELSFIKSKPLAFALFPAFLPPVLNTQLSIGRFLFWCFILIQHQFLLLCPVQILSIFFAMTCLFSHFFVVVLKVHQSLNRGLPHGYFPPQSRHFLFLTERCFRVCRPFPPGLLVPSVSCFKANCNDNVM